MSILQFQVHIFNQPSRKLSRTQFQVDFSQRKVFASMCWRRRFLTFFCDSHKNSMQLECVCRFKGWWKFLLVLVLYGTLNGGKATEGIATTEFQFTPLLFDVNELSLCVTSRSLSMSNSNVFSIKNFHSIVLRLADFHFAWDNFEFTIFYCFFGYFKN